MSSILVGNAPCSWGSLEFEGLEGKPVPYGQMLDELVTTGYTGTELGDWGYMPTDPAVLHAELERRRVALVGAFVPVRLKEAAAHADGAAAAVRIARLLAEVHERAGQKHAPFLVLADDNGTDPARTQNAGRVGADLGLSEPEWRTFVDGVNRVANEVRERAGLRTVFHHHCAGYIETTDEIAQLLDRTDPGLLGLVFDTGHHLYGSGTSDGTAGLAAMDRFAERIWYVHLKDCSREVAEQARAEGWDYFTAVRHGVFCELGRGAVDFPGVVNWLKARHYDGWALVEQDVLPGLGTPRESAQRNRDYLRSIGL
ncbi:MAG: TIM barrel protein [Verrucomicrobiales bacterium]|nr:TIM barrel protein [Verrucomicrobiales bacterium]